jgi:nucleotide-binding universal stress UspA family protein
MNKKLITIAVLPFVKAQNLRIVLDRKNIPCILEDLNLMEGTTSLSVRVQIYEVDLEKAFPILEEFLGKQTKPQPAESDTYKQVLVPVDFSAFSFKAAKVAFDIAKILKVRMVLFHAYPNPIAYSVPFSDIYAFDTGLLAHLENAEKTAQTNMEQFLKNLVAHFSKETWSLVETEYILKAGDARDDIISYANLNKVMLIVMGTQGKTGNEYDIIGSVTAEIINSTRVPILAIPAETPDNITGVFHKILYATNFDEKDFVALDKLMRIINPYNAEVHCVHVGHNDEPEWNLAKLEGMKDILRSKYQSLSFECHLLIGMDFLAEIDRFISENNIDVLALTTHKRSMIARLFNPSIARKMLFHGHIPLLVFHA